MRRRYAKEHGQYFRDLNELIEIMCIMEAVKRGWSMHQLAIEADLCPQTVYNLDAGITQYPRFSTIWKMAHAVGLKINLTAASSKSQHQRPKLRIVRAG